MKHCERTDEHEAHAELCRGVFQVCSGLPTVSEFDLDYATLCEEHE